MAGVQLNLTACTQDQLICGRGRSRRTWRRDNFVGIAGGVNGCRAHLDFLRHETLCFGWRCQGSGGGPAGYWGFGGCWLVLLVNLGYGGGSSGGGDDYVGRTPTWRVPLLLLRPDWRAPPLPDVRPFRLAADDLTAISSLQYRVSGERNPEHYCAPPFSRSP